MASVEHARQEIETRWGDIDFDFHFYTGLWYHQMNGKKEIDAAAVQGTHQWINGSLTWIEKQLGDFETLSHGGVLVLLAVARELCAWNIRHPLPSTDPGVAGGFVRWQNAAVLAKEAKDTNRITDDVEDWNWDALTAYYLKVWDLQMHEAED